ncbi:pentapeptide repeat-containing protein [Streptomyces paromomycinus]|uniref:Pentapeptide repeat-containing protein n=1 Tax=Streptomyces paromomycinus TaxID=92743 RepID=A0A401VTM7_STREY|nr:pentapeptide repeat-containing protein [Streptomyces paromomycinus]GCD40359.1 hypothetical protein GKJPGBOP_00008 [Streptomyces paromomycinus]
MVGAHTCRSNLTGASLVRANFDDASLRDARLDEANLVKASLCDVDASGASWRGTQIMGASLLDVDLRGADLTNAVVKENSFKVRVDANTIFNGFSGTIFGPIEVVSENGTQEVGGDDLERFIQRQGGNIRVLPRGEAR